MAQIPQVKELYFNWHQNGSVQSKDGAGEDWERVEKGKHGVETIKEHLPKGEGDRLYYDVIINGKISMRIFNPNQVIYFP